MAKTILITLWEKIKKFAEIEKRGPYSKATFDPTLAKMRLMVLAVVFVLAFLCWLLNN
jgi:hypothetical protein